MKKTILFFQVIIVLLALKACSVNINQGVNVVSLSSKSFDGAPSKNLSVKSFSAITNNSPITVECRQSEECGVVVLGDTGMFDSLRIEVVGEELRIGLEPGIYKDLWLKVLVYAPHISSIHQSGSGDIMCDTIDREAQVDISASGSGNIYVNGIDCNNMKMQVSGSGTIKANRVSANNARLSVAGSGIINLSDVKVEDELAANCSGSGNISVNGTAQNVRASVTGSGTINGKLDHKNINTSTTGSGRIDL